MDFVTITAFLFSGISLLVCAWLILSKQKLTLSNKQLQSKIFVLENNILAQGEKKDHSSTEKKDKIPQQKMQNENNINHQSSQELLHLRKENSKLKDDIKKAKEEIKNKEKALKEEEVASKNKLFSLTEENSRFITQLKELDLQLKEALNNQRNNVPLIDFEKKMLEISQFKEENSTLKSKLNEVDKFKKTQQAKISSLQEKLKLVEHDLSLWLDAAKTNDGKPLDPAFFVKWHDRAITARKMYKLMRQMRELSDAKVTSYQEGIANISQWVLNQKNIPIPQVSSGEVLADRLLAEAWNAIMPVNAKTTGGLEISDSSVQTSSPS
ncbi:hypothetical protein QEJ31_01970 [Pigmentibacter sp. JX0631]|uniref:hypothetical protein n=1 Tax=Pigmentibacter sp. JX0631 TaxID=2976982 RepID=UPI0024688FB7|nr:hypothetical protein [Pigmentibacter sp. JX0631]WGL60370.1 hypothetical protein QEJ31_01970 [Pigmentibacter sp. JX0631]